MLFIVCLPVEVLESPGEGLLIESGWGLVPVTSGVVLVTVGEVLLMDAASGVMLVMGGWGRVEVG